MANDAPLVMRVDMLGCNFELDHDPSLWTWANTFESWESLPGKLLRWWLHQIQRAGTSCRGCASFLPERAP